MKLWCISLIGIMLLAGCGIEYGDIHGSAASFDRIMGHKVRPKEVLALRSGSIDFRGSFIFEFPESSKGFFESPPQQLFTHPMPLSYEKDKIFVKWKRTPFAPEHVHFFTQSLQQAISIGLPQEYAVALTNLAQTTNGLYAISYENNGSQRSHNVDLFIIDPQTRRFYQFVDTNSSFEPNKAIDNGQE